MGNDMSEQKDDRAAVAFLPPPFSIVMMPPSAFPGYACASRLVTKLVLPCSSIT